MRDRARMVWNKLSQGARFAWLESEKLVCMDKSCECGKFEFYTKPFDELPELAQTVLAHSEMDLVRRNG